MHAEEAQTPSSVIPIQPSEYADVAASAKLALTVTLTLAIAFLGFVFTVPEDAWIRPILVDRGEGLASAFFFVLVFDLCRRGHWFDGKSPAVWWLLQLVNYAALVYAAFALLSILANLKGAEHYKTSDLYKARKAELECLDQLSKEQEQALHLFEQTSSAWQDCRHEQRERARLKLEVSPTACSREKAAVTRTDRAFKAAKDKACPVAKSP